ncbi:peptidoglycan-binding protein, partial [Streptomyces sp. Act-28]
AAHPAEPLRPAGPAGLGRDTSQGGGTGSHGHPPAGPTSGPHRAALPATTRADIIDRAERWVAERVPYSTEEHRTDGYRPDCSGYVSMAWQLPANEWTGSLHHYGTRVAWADLRPGDILLFHDPADPAKGSHVTIFGGWTDHRRTHYVAYEQTEPHTRRQVTPLAYWTDSGRYVGYRRRGVVAGGPSAGGPSSTAFPGARHFGPGAVNTHVARLGRMLVERGGARFYEKGPGSGWSEADRRATAAFQRAQGWRGAEANGLPGPHTWRLLTTGRGRDIPPAAGRTPPPYPGRAHFRPGQSNKHVEALGRQLVRRGHGKHYRTGPNRRWSEADRRNVQDFQRAQGWRGGAANGFPGPETWRRLFR